MRRSFRRTPTLRVKLTRTVQITHELKNFSIYPCHVQLADFAENTNLASNFERVTISKVVCKIFPHQNVANNSTSRLPNYCIFPYHRGIANAGALLNFPTALSIDKAKVYRSTQIGRMSFVPMARLRADPESTNFTVSKWRPTFDIGRESMDQWLYCGYLAFEHVAELEGSSYFTMVQDVYVTYKNQRSFIQ